MLRLRRSVSSYLGLGAMDLPKPSEWKLGEATKSLMKDLEEIAYQVNEIRPLTGPVLKTVQQQLLGERVSAATRLRGIP